MCFNFSSRKKRLQMRGPHSWPRLLLVFYIFFPPPFFWRASLMALLALVNVNFFWTVLFNFQSSLVAALSPGFLQFCVHLIFFFCVSLAHRCAYSGIFRCISFLLMYLIFLMYLFLFWCISFFDVSHFFWCISFFFNVFHFFLMYFISVWCISFFLCALPIATPAPGIPTFFCNITFPPLSFQPCSSDFQFFGRFIS